MIINCFYCGKHEEKPPYGSFYEKNYNLVNCVGICKECFDKYSPKKEGGIRYDQPLETR